MTPERHELLRRLFAQAIERPREQWQALLEEFCGSDAELRSQLEALLAEHELAETLVATPQRSPIVSGAGDPTLLHAGTVVDGRYRIEATLGVGGMGAVYRATQLQLQRAVALKVVRGELLVNPAIVGRFRREALAVARLKHPHIVSVFDFGQEPGTGAYLVMEYVEGRSLRQELRCRGRLPIPQAVELMRQVCAGVSAAHASGVIHRDLKPENILLEGDGEQTTAKVVDFGIAKLVQGAEPPEEALTLSGTVLGTPAYMSPEQCRGEAADARADVYALGCILYEMVTGRLPITAATVFALLTRHQMEVPAPLGERLPGVSAELERIVARALAKRREERWQTVAELGGALTSLTLGVRPRQVSPSALPSRESATYVGALAETYELHADTGGWARVTAAADNLPRLLTSCIGRERELSELVALLESEPVRLVTITGAGGIGKTRLAVESARAMLPRFPDGVFEVDLAPLSEPSLVAQHVAQQFGVKESAGRPIAENLGQFLREKRMLLLLDNFEHLLGAAPLVAELLEAAPGLKALVTSQAMLRLRGEREYALDALELPGAGSLAPLEELERAPAVALFLERAREAKPGFALTAENARAVVEICRRLDGLPLAIELAAARLKLLAPQAMLERLEHRLTLLTGGARDLPERQRTMRDAVRWSYELLDEAERSLLRALAVFAGGCTLEAAQAVCGSAGLDVLEGMGSLVDKSLLRQRDQSDGELRFRMLEVVREFALERLEAEGEAEAAHLRHAHYYLELARQNEQNMKGPLDEPWFERLVREHEDFTLALGLLLEREPREGANMVAGLWRSWHDRSLFSEGLEWSRRALGSGAAVPRDCALVHSAAGVFETELGHLEAAGEHHREAVRVGRTLDDKRLLVAVLSNAGLFFMQSGMGAQARAHYEEALAIMREIGDEAILSTILINLGDVAATDGDYARARAYTEEALGLSLSKHTRALCLINLGDMSVAEEDFAGGRVRLREALALFARLRDQRGITAALECLAALALKEGSPGRAARLAGAVEAFYDGTEGVRRQPDVAPWERLLSELREALGASAFEREWGRGRAMCLERAVEEALASE